MAEVTFNRGEFKPYRATTKVHLGPIEQDLHENDIILFDGQTAKIGEETHSGLSVLKSAVRVGWLVPAEDSSSKYVPKAANISIRPAQSASQDRGEPMEVMTVQDEERDLGTIDSVRESRRASEEASGSVRGRDTDDGHVVSRVKTPTQQSTRVVDSHAAAQEINKLDNSPPPKAEPVATGDVQEAISGETLEDLLPDAVSSERPSPGVAGEDQNMDDVAEAIEDAAAQSSAPPVMDVIRALIPEFEWDMSRHWKTRVKMAVSKHGDDRTYINAIKMIETDTVVKHIEEALKA